jgi:glycerophosphoryl diester phosphodiesterase
MTTGPAQAELGSLTLRDVHPFVAQPGPIAVAHRGGAGEAPENTLPAFEIARTLGYKCLETDAHLTRDGVLVAFADERLDRVTDRTGGGTFVALARVRVLCLSLPRFAGVSGSGRGV